ncbi:MAG: RHS repeat-associated core domain-containing protein [Syntrophobacteraceae bacterium]
MSAGSELLDPLYEYSLLGLPTTQMVRVSANEKSGGSGSVWKEVFFDGLGREYKTRSEGPDGEVIAALTDYDNRGRVEKKYLPRFESSADPERYVSFQYDDLGRVTQKNNPDGKHTEMKYVQGKTTAIDEKGHARSQIVNANGKLARVEELPSPDPSQPPYATTTYDYDALGNLTQVVDAGNNVTTMTYDLLSRKTTMSDPDMGFWAYPVYDGNGNLKEQQGANGNVLRFDYDALNREIRKYCSSCSPENAIDVTYHYDEGQPSDNGKGRLTRVEDASGTTEYAYDKQGKVIRTIKTVDGIAYTSGATYDAMGRAETVTHPHRQGDTPETLTYTYDAGGNLEGVWFDVNNPDGFYAKHSGYNALGQVGRIDYENGVYTEHTYQEDNNRLEYLKTGTDANPGGLQNLKYTYDDVGNIQEITDLRTPAKTQIFVYDDLNRLTTATSESYRQSNPTDTVTYEYDTIGNMTYNSRVGSYDYASAPGKPHAVLQAGPYSFVYDANGNMVSKNSGQRTIVYDAENHVKRITTGASTVEFVYDHKGERVKKIQGGVEIVYIGGLLEIRGTEVRKHYASAGKKIATRIDNTLYNTHGDHLGSLGLATAESSPDQPRQETVYYPFDETAGVQNGDVGLHHKFTGQEEDPETGLYYYGARYYDPVIGRFLSADSIVQAPADPQTLNRYSYCRNNPLIYTDPTGHDFGLTAFIAAIIIGAAVGAATAAISGGDVAMGAATGAISGACFAFSHVAIAALAKVVQAGMALETAAAAIHISMAAGSGAANAAITGGDPGMGAATAAVSAGVARGMGGLLARFGATKPVDSIGDIFSKDYAIQLGSRMATGAVAGGVTSSMMGGNFGDGAFNGAWTAGYGMVFNDALILGGEAAFAFGAGGEVKALEGVGFNGVVSGGAVISFDEGVGKVFTSFGLGPEGATMGGGGATGRTVGYWRGPTRDMAGQGFNLTVAAGVVGITVSFSSTDSWGVTLSGLGRGFGLGLYGNASFTTLW